MGMHSKAKMNYLPNKNHNWFIVGMDELYCGNGGMYNYGWLFNATDREAEEMGYELSSQVIDSYSCIMEAIEEDGGEYDDDIAYECYVLKDGITEEMLKVYDREGHDYTDFVDKFCHKSFLY